MVFVESKKKTLQELGNERHYKTPYKKLYNKLLIGAKKKNLEVSLTYKQFLEFTKIHRCDYCGDGIKWVPHGKKAIRYNLDRIDNNKGYTKENCVVCCPDCNFFKLNRSTGKFLAKIEKIFRYSLE